MGVGERLGQIVNARGKKGNRLGGPKRERPWGKSAATRRKRVTNVEHECQRKGRRKRGEGHTRKKGQQKTPAAQKINNIPPSSPPNTDKRC